MNKNNAIIYQLKKLGIKEMKKRSIYECAVYCEKNGLNLKTFEKDKIIENSTNYIFYDCSWHEYFSKSKKKVNKK